MKWKKKIHGTKKFRGRKIASAVGVLGVLAVCLGVIGYRGNLKAEETYPVVSRGVIDQISQIPESKKNLFDSKDKDYMNTLGQKQNPMLILEIVPYEDFATFGYHISGCEPIDPETNYGHSLPMEASISLGTSSAVRQDPAYFFSDEPESKPDAYDEDKVPQIYDSEIGKGYEGYYEMVEDGKGTFIQDDSGKIVKGTGDGKNNIIWHTVCKTEKERKYSETEFIEASDSYKKLENIGDRIYTERMSSNDDKVLRTYGYYYYENKDDFLRYSVLPKNVNDVVKDEDVKNYSVIIKTITPDELNNAPEWADYADLFVVSRKSYMDSVTKSWVYNRYGHESKLPAKSEDDQNADGSKKTYDPRETFVGNDLNWTVVEKIFNKVTDDTNYAGMIMGSSMYTLNDENYAGATKDQTNIPVYDWNLNKIYRPDTGAEVTIESGIKCNCNMYKLALMLICMKNNIFKKVFADQIKDGECLFREGDDRTYWSKSTFWLMNSTDIQVLWSPYEKYFGAENMWKDYGIYNELSTERSWVNGHFFSFNDDNSLTFSYATGNDKANSRFTDYQDHLNKFYNVNKDNGDQDHNGGPADAVRYILDRKNQSSDNDKITGDLNILDIEPSYDSKNGYSLNKRYISMMLPEFDGDINITHMTTAEFIGSAEDLNSTYNMIYIGLDDGAYRKEKSNLQNGTLWENSMHTAFNDSLMNGKIYFHTGDLVSSAEKDYWGNRSVKFLYPYQNDTTIRFSGNDITKLKKTELEKFMDAGYPIVTASYLYDEDQLRIDQNSYLCKLVKEQKKKTDTKLLKETNVSGIANIIKNAFPSITFTQLPESYNGESDDGTIDKNAANYLKPNADGDWELPFAFDVNDTSGKKYKFRILVDQNKNGKFETGKTTNSSTSDNNTTEADSDENEILYTSDEFTAGEKQEFLQPISNLYKGMIQWQIEVYQVDNPNIHFIKTGCSAISNGKDTVRVLQIIPRMPYCKKKGENKDNIYKNVYRGYLNLSKNDVLRPEEEDNTSSDESEQSRQEFIKYYDKLNDYDIQVSVMVATKAIKELDNGDAYLQERTDWDTYNKYSNKIKDLSYYFNAAHRFSFNYSQEVSGSNPAYMSEDQKALFNSYDMIIIGFGDSYGNTDISNDYGAVDFIKYFAAQGKSVLFTHDLTSMLNVKPTSDQNYGYTANKLLRDLMGMNRYQVVSNELSDHERGELQAYQTKNKDKYDSLIGVNGTELQQKQGYTYYAIKRLAWPHNDKNQKMPYQYMIKNLADEFICTHEGTAKYTGFNNYDDLTDKIEKTNMGQITQYPYKINDTISIAKTHAQWYQLNMEDPDVTVWYTLKGVSNEETPIKLDYDSYGDGTSVTYGVSPKDAANNYYIYSKGNIFYSGVGHSTIKGADETKLFINTMIAAFRASYKSPLVQILNKEAQRITDSTDPLQYEITQISEYDEDTGVLAGPQKEDEEGQEDKDHSNDYVKIRFRPVELNLISTKLKVSIKYDGSNYVRKIYTTKNNQEIEISATFKDGKWEFENMQNMKEYYFYYPKKYFEDALHNKLIFEISNNKKNVLPGKTYLNMSKQNLFMLD